jgi:hypothetical protein
MRMSAGQMNCLSSLKSTGETAALWSVGERGGSQNGSRPISRCLHGYGNVMELQTVNFHQLHYVGLWGRDVRCEM